ncbi:unnamed protein product, partial [marine sediment metagenome]
MGEEPGPEYTPGAICGNCWGPGRPFGDVPTPKYASITFSGLVGIWAPANKKFIGTQDPLAACIWRFEDAIFTGWYLYGDALTEVLLAFKPGNMP